MTALKVKFGNQEQTLQEFDRIADQISKEISIKVNSGFYRIVDFEFYAYAATLPDPHTYKNDLQLQNSKIYLHGSGFDITIGDEINHGGVLIRSIVKLNDGSSEEHGFMKQQFNGPQVVATELFSNLKSLDSSEKNEISLVAIRGTDLEASFCPPIKIIKTKRVGLTPKPTDKDDFYRKLPLRYITILPQFPKFKQNIKGIESLLGEQVINGQLSVEEAREMLGYKRSFA